MSVPDFTEREYDALVRLAASHYRFIGFDCLDLPKPVVLWRHDVDCSPQRAVALAQIEARHGVRATYFVNLHSDFYNLLEPSNVEAVLGIVELGHNLGLHFDPHAVSKFDSDLDPWVARERQLLQDVFGVEVRAFSTHNPTLVDALDRRDTAAGMVNASGADLASRFESAPTRTACGDSSRSAWCSSAMRLNACTCSRTRTGGFLASFPHERVSRGRSTVGRPRSTFDTTGCSRRQADRTCAGRMARISRS